MAILLLKAGEINDLFPSLVLSQIISEPTNFEPNCNSSYIDLVVTDQPNRDSLDSYLFSHLLSFSFDST